ncbi:hypothetical protein phiOC_p401 [Ochrobactrum phage vB_OspM_OC]|nr:hypothetical protein phiOC_p401 [Ochrobactrum phage vB_OspM_OC]
MLTKSNVEIYAAQHYTHICISTDEFIEDLKRVRKIRRLMRHYKSNGTLQTNSILNHIRILYNVFEHHALTNILYMELHGHEDVLSPFLILLDFFPKEVVYDNKVIPTDGFNLDQKVISELRKIIKG